MESKTYQTIETYKEVVDSLYAISGIILYCFAKHNCNTKNIIIRNFIARSSISLKSILTLWDMNDFQSAWIIYRSMIDRMFHLHDIGEKDKFTEFDDWSFFEKYKSHNKLKSDNKFKHNVVGEIYELSIEQKNRIKKLEKEKPQWGRPKAENVAKEMGMMFLYNYGYDPASTHVHPMSDDGLQDFHTITKLESYPESQSDISVVHNSIISSSMILQDALNYSSFQWRHILFDYIDEVRDLLKDGNKSYQLSFLKLMNLIKNESLCKANES
ncbi:MAG: DUF5677 domain-containing protein [Arcobacter sp.]|uniref:DUF5677 domain-containing protein n=1 Tax=Arcobacter sp. TaxID=1872629 RepID=UPI003B00AD89